MSSDQRARCRTSEWNRPSTRSLPGLVSTSPFSADTKNVLPSSTTNRSAMPPHHRLEFAEWRCRVERDGRVVTPVPVVGEDPAHRRVHPFGQSVAEVVFRPVLVGGFRYGQCDADTQLLDPATDEHLIAEERGHHYRHLGQD